MIKIKNIKKSIAKIEPLTKAKDKFLALKKKTEMPTIAGATQVLTDAECYQIVMQLLATMTESQMRLDNLAEISTDERQEGINHFCNVLQNLNIDHETRTSINDAALMAKIYLWLLEICSEGSDSWKDCVVGAPDEWVRKFFDPIVTNKFFKHVDFVHFENPTDFRLHVRNFCKVFYERSFTQGFPMSDDLVMLLWTKKDDVSTLYENHFNDMENEDWEDIDAWNCIVACLDNMEDA